MNNLNQNSDPTGIDSTMLKVSEATPLYLFFACIASFVILLVVQTVHDIEMWGAKMPTIGIFLGIAGPLFVQAVRFGGLLGSTFNFSRKNIFAGILCITLSVATSLWEHSHVPAIAAFYITEANSWAEIHSLTSFLQIMIWIGLGLELLIVASVYGKLIPQTLPNRQQTPQPRRPYSPNHEDAFDLDSLMNGNGAKH